MPQLLNINFADAKLVTKVLQSFYGIGPFICRQVMARHFIHPGATIGSLGNQKMLELTSTLMDMQIENDKRRDIRENIKRLRDIGTYRGRRHAMGLPARGQRTRTQILTARKLNRVERRG